MKPLVSIIIPVYNVQDYLVRCLDSVVNQTYNNIEILIINDGSTDNSKEIIQDYKEKYSNIIFYDQTNAGQASARNKGIKECSGEYILFVDSDDWIELNCVEECVQALISSYSDLVIFDINTIKSNSIIKQVTGTNIFDSESVPWNKMYKKELWEGHQFPEGVWYEDLGVVPVIVGLTSKKVKLNKSLYNYNFTRNGSQSHQINNDKNMDILKMLQIVDVFLKGNVNENELEFLFIKHIVKNLIIRKLLVSNNINNENILEAIEFIQTRFPRWENNSFYNRRRGITSYVEKFTWKLVKYKRFKAAGAFWKIATNFN